MARPAFKNADAGAERQGRFLRATGFEFRYRFWIIAAIMGTGFAFYAFESANTGVALANAIAALRGTPRTTALVRLSFSIGGALALLGAGIRTWGAAYPGQFCGARTRTSRPAAGGPYRRVRNPLYLGTLLLGTGLGVMAPRTGFVFLLAALMLFLYRIVLREERALFESRGEIFRAYRAAVPRLLPALLPRVPKNGSAPDWKGAILGEIATWLLASSVAVFAWTFDMRLFLRVAATAIAIYGIRFAVTERRRNRIPRS